MNNLLKHTVLTLLSLLVTGVLFSQDISLDKASEIAGEFLNYANKQKATDNILIKKESYPLTGNQKTIAYVFNLAPQGFVVVSAFDYPNPVIGFSLTDNIPGKEEIIHFPVYSVIANISRAREEVMESGISPVLTKGTDDFIVGPHVYTLWGQVNCHTNTGQLVNVTNYYTPNHYAAGCVAISLSTLLHYYKWPVVGKGYHEYYDGLGSSTGWYNADFGNTYYKWSLMRNKYNNQASTEEEREAAGELAFHAAVALDMNFEYYGSTSNVNKIPSTGSNYFRFYSFYKPESSNVFWTRLDKNIMEANPVILAVENNSGGGHSIVCDGLWVKDDSSLWYHLNMGWWGAGNGWFTIRDGFNAGGYTTINGGILDFIPKPYLYDAQMYIDTNMFTLRWQYTHTIDAEMFEVQHKVNNGQWETITDNYQDTALLIVVNNAGDDNYYRVRPKVNGYWYPSIWSNQIKLNILTGTDYPVEESDDWEVFPNPFTTAFVVKTHFAENRKQVLKIFDVKGNLVYENNDLINQLTVNTEKWASGIYYLEMSNGKSVRTRKVIKK